MRLLIRYLGLIGFFSILTSFLIRYFKLPAAQSTALSSNRNCSSILDTHLISNESFLRNKYTLRELIILNGISEHDEFGKITLNRKIKSSNNTPDFQLEFRWKNTVSQNKYWTISQPLNNQINDLINFSYSIYLVSASDSSGLRLYFEESDGDRWIIDDFAFSKKIQKQRWHQFNISKSQLKFLPYGDKSLNGQILKALS